MSFFEYEVSHRISRIAKRSLILQVDNLINWEPIKQQLKGLFKNEEAGIAGNKPYDALKMFKALLLGQWHNLRDPSLEEALSVRMDFMKLTGFSVEEEVPDETSFCRFRNRLIEHSRYEKLLEEINRQLEQMGLKVKEAPCALVDATLIESVARPNRVIELKEEGKEETEEVNNALEIKESADEEARWLKKGKKSYYGYKGFVRVESQEGYVEKVLVEPANQAECKKLAQMVEKAKAKRIMADKGLASQENRQYLKEQKLKDGIMSKASRGHELSY